MAFYDFNAEANWMRMEINRLNDVIKQQQINLSFFQHQNATKDDILENCRKSLVNSNQSQMQLKEEIATLRRKIWNLEDIVKRGNLQIQQLNVRIAAYEKSNVSYSKIICETTVVCTVCQLVAVF